MKDESDLELARRLALQAGKLLNQHRINNPPPDDLAKRKEYGEQADKLAHNFLMAEFIKAKAIQSSTTFSYQSSYSIC